MIKQTPFTEIAEVTLQLSLKSNRRTFIAPKIENKTLVVLTLPEPRDDRWLSQEVILISENPECELLFNAYTNGGRGGRCYPLNGVFRVEFFVAPNNFADGPRRWFVAGNSLHEGGSPVCLPMLEPNLHLIEIVKRVYGPLSVNSKTKLSHMDLE